MDLPWIRTRWLACTALFGVVGCGDDENDDDVADSANDEMPGDDDGDDGDSTAGDDAADDAADDDGSASSGADAADAGSEGGGACVGPGEPCGPNDYCNTWLCACLNSQTEFMTIGVCDEGVCEPNGTLACTPICEPNGGIASVVDGGCG
jgi:hypothetical protein